jgi:hypothetical protein
MAYHNEIKTKIGVIQVGDVVRVGDKVGQGMVTSIEKKWGQVKVDLDMKEGGVDTVYDWEIEAVINIA